MKNMYSLRHIEFIVKSYATKVPLDAFAFFGSFLEEIIPPIPAPLIMTTAGSIAFSQQRGWMFLLWIAMIGSIGKTFASWIFYVLGEKFEHIAIGRFGKYIGISTRDVEHLGKKFNGGWRDDIALFALRSIPVFPSVSLSVVCGIIRLNKKTFIWATFLGTIVKNLFYLYAGYGGVRAIGFLTRKIHYTHFWLGTLFILVSCSIIYWMVHKRKKAS